MNEKRLETFIVILEVATSILKGLKKLRGIFKTKKGVKPPSFFTPQEVIYTKKERS